MTRGTSKATCEQTHAINRGGGARSGARVGALAASIHELMARQVQCPVRQPNDLVRAPGQSPISFLHMAEFDDPGMDDAQRVLLRFIEWLISWETS